MSSISVSIGRLVATARKLRQAADELGNVDLKSQIIDEISTLQEIREELSLEGGSHDLSRTELAAVVKAAASAKVEEPAPEKAPAESGKLMLKEAKFAVIAPSDDGETYGIGADADEETDDADDSSKDDQETGTREGEVETVGVASTVKEKPGSEDKKSMAESEPERKPKKAKPKLTTEQRAMAEMRIADLEPLERDAQRRLDTVLTPEQKEIKVQATKAGREAGKSSRDLQLYVHKAMKTTPEQRHQISAARKDLQRVREAIDKERDVLDADGDEGDA